MHDLALSAKRLSEIRLDLEALMRASPFAHASWIMHLGVVWDVGCHGVPDSPFLLTQGIVRLSLMAALVLVISANLILFRMTNSD